MSRIKEYQRHTNTSTIKVRKLSKVGGNYLNMDKWLREFAFFVLYQQVGYHSNQ